MSQILEPAGQALRIDVISDVVCPWCYVGKRQLEAALERWQADHPDAPAPIVRWHPFQLNPDFPEAGMARADYLQRKFGTADPGAIYQRVQAAAAAVGLAPEFAKIARQPNTLRAHALIAAAPDQASQQAVVERLFQAYFVEGADLSSRDVLATLAAEAGAVVLETDAPETACFELRRRPNGVMTAVVANLTGLGAQGNADFRPRVIDLRLGVPVAELGYTPEQVRISAPDAGRSDELRAVEVQDGLVWAAVRVDAVALVDFLPPG